MDTRYTEAVAAYLREREAADAEIDAAHRAYESETAALTAAVDTARAERDRANQDAVAAATLVAETDKTVALAWRSLGSLVGHRRTGPTPLSDAAGPAPDAEAVRARLARATTLLALARQGELPIDAPRHTGLTAAGIGAAIGAAAVAVAAWILGAGDGSARAAIAAVVLFGGVAVSPVVSGAWLSWQYRVRPGPVQTVACVAAALTATCALAAVFLRGM